MSVISSPLSHHRPQRQGSVCRDLPLLICNGDSYINENEELVKTHSVQSHISTITSKSQRPQVLFHSQSFPPPSSTIRSFTTAITSQLVFDREPDNINIVHAPQPRRLINLDKALEWKAQQWSDLSNDEIRSIRNSFASLNTLVRPRSFRSALLMPAHESCNQITENVELRLECDNDADSNDGTLPALTDDTATESVKSLSYIDVGDHYDEEEDDEEFGPLTEQQLYHKRDLDTVKHNSRRITLSKYDPDILIGHTAILTSTTTVATKENNEEIHLSTKPLEAPLSEIPLATSGSFRLRSDNNSIRRRLRRLLDTRTRSAVWSSTTGPGSDPLGKAEGYHKRSKSGGGGSIHAAYEVNIPRVVGPPMELMHGERSYESRDLWS